MSGGSPQFSDSGPAQISPLLSQRNIINIDDPAGFYGLINRVSQGRTTLTPGTFFNTSASTWNQLIDSTGYPNTSIGAGTFSCTASIPDFNIFTGPYVLTWDGDGTLSIGSGTWTESNNTGTTYTKLSNAKWSNVSGQTAKIIMSITGGSITGHEITITVNSTGGPGGFVKNIRFYEQADEADLLAGKIWRTAFKQSYVNLNPAAIRFMPMFGQNNGRNCRFENRSLPVGTGYVNSTNHTVSPPYGETTGNPQYLLAAATTTSGNSRTTPVAMTHGEIATCRVGTTTTRSRYFVGFLDATADTKGSISAANPGVMTNNGNTRTGSASGSDNNITGLASVAGLVVGDVAFRAGVAIGKITVIGSTSVTLDTPTSSASSVSYFFGHVFTYNTNDWIVFTEMAPDYPTLDTVPFQITKINDSQFSIGVDTTGLQSAFTSGRATVLPYVTLNVGGRPMSDGTPSAALGWPILATSAIVSAIYFGSISGQAYHTFYFDKTISAKRDASGNWIMGAWLWNGGGAHLGEMPVEIITVLITELNVMARAQGNNNPIHMWLNMAAWGLDSNDPDTSTGSVWAPNVINTVLNGANGFAGLDSAASVIIEYQNETWNPGSAFAATKWLANRGFYRWTGGQLPLGGGSDFASMSSLRAVSMARDVKAKFPGNARLIFSLGGQAIASYTPFGQNYNRINGTATYSSDALVTGGSWGTPISNHDAFHTACYFSPPSSYFSTVTGAGTFTDDSAMYNGTDNSGTLSMVGGTGGVASTTLTITGIGGGTPAVKQPLVGTGITSPATYITAVSGVAPNYTLTLNQTATVANGTTITAPSNGGGNYSGAANPSQSIANMTTQTVSGNSNAFGTLNSYLTIRAAIANAGPMVNKKSIEYEGGISCINAVGASQSGHVITANDQLFLYAWWDSASLGSAQAAYYTSAAAISGCAVHGQFLATNHGANFSTDRNFGFTSPDSYGGTSTEGQGFLNNGAWIALSTRNQALTA